MGKLSENGQNLIRSFDQLTIKKIRGSYGQQKSTKAHEEDGSFLKEYKLGYNK